MKSNILRFLQYFIVINITIFVLYNITMAGYSGDSVVRYAPSSWFSN